MDIIYFLLPASLILAILALVGFIWSARSGQFEDVDTPARRMLLDDPDGAPSPQEKKLKK